MNTEPILVEQIRTGGDRNFGYLAADALSREAFIVDPSYSPEGIVLAAHEAGYRLRYVFSTHGHVDHTCGNADIQRLTGLEPLLLGSTCPSTGILVEDGARFPLGNGEVLIVHTPGHTADSICILYGDALFTGDTLFVGKVGGTATEDDARAQYDSLHRKLMTLPSPTQVWPGHDYGAHPSSDIDSECASNPFLIQKDFASFFDLKQNWPAYKRAHGIA
ncbi:MAG: MBL fold metallo-hydrolase [Chlorobium sp.]|nr:MBL fold metallo-hydrolase [Chlorobium sp.]